MQEAGESDVCAPGPAIQVLKQGSQPSQKGPLSTCDGCHKTLMGAYFKSSTVENLVICAECNSKLGTSAEGEWQLVQVTREPPQHWKQDEAITRIQTKRHAKEIDTTLGALLTKVMGTPKVQFCFTTNPESLSRAVNEEVQNLMRSIDLNSDGEVDRSELAQGLTWYGIELTQGALDAVMRHFDTDKSGRISRTEFSTCLLDFYAKNSAKFRPTTTSLTPAPQTAELSMNHRDPVPSQFPEKIPQKRRRRTEKDVAKNAEPTVDTTPAKSTSPSLPNGWIQIFDDAHKR
jgi:hypothetical protein